MADDLVIGVFDLMLDDELDLLVDEQLAEVLPGKEPERLLLRLVLVLERVLRSLDAGKSERFGAGNAS
jgi:hypothetical protein